VKGLIKFKAKENDQNKSVSVCFDGSFFFFFFSFGCWNVLCVYFKISDFINTQHHNMQHLPLPLLFSLRCVFYLYASSIFLISPLYIVTLYIPLIALPSFSIFIKGRTALMQVVRVLLAAVPRIDLNCENNMVS
jgi:hypothetical protein